MKQARQTECIESLYSNNYLPGWHLKTSTDCTPSLLQNPSTASTKFPPVHWAPKGHLRHEINVLLATMIEYIPLGQIKHRSWSGKLSSLLIVYPAGHSISRYRWYLAPNISTDHLLSFMTGSNFFPSGQVAPTKRSHYSVNHFWAGICCPPSMISLIC